MEKEVITNINSAKFREGNISIVLDSYDDVFSDFDPRHYEVRALSDDFLLECKKAALVKKDKPELIFLIPKKRRNYADEVKIKKRLKEYFHKHFNEQKRGIKKLRGLGVFWFALGALAMALMPFLLEYEQFAYKILIIMAEPAGWFFFWEGLYMFFITAKDKKPDYDFYKKMSTSEIHFYDY